MTEHAACQGVPDLKSAICVLAHVAPRGYFERTPALGAVNRFGHGLALELAAVPCVQIGKELFHVFYDSVAEFYWRQRSLFHLRKLVFPFAGHLG